MKEINGIKMFSTNELADMIGVNRSVIYKAVKDGKLRAVRLSRSYYVSEESLKDYLNGRNNN